MPDLLSNFYQHKKVLITGHTGFKGSWLTHTLLQWGAHLVGIALEPATRPNLFTLLEIRKRVHHYSVDIRDFLRVKKIFQQEKPEIVFHLAAQPLVRDSYDDPRYTFETNVIGTVNVLEALRAIPCVRAAILVTTDKVYENEGNSTAFQEEDKLGGSNPYSASKAGAEIAIDCYRKSYFDQNHPSDAQTLCASVRAGNVIGGGDWSKDRLLSDIVKATFEQNAPILIRNPDAIRPWQYVLEPQYGYMLLAKRLYEGKKEFCGAWNFGPHPESHVSVKALLEEAFRLFEQGSYIIQKDPTKPEDQTLRLDCSKAISLLGWQPTVNLSTTLKLTTDWYKTFYSKGNVLSLTNQQLESFFSTKRYEL